MFFHTMSIRALGLSLFCVCLSVYICNGRDSICDFRIIHPLRALSERLGACGVLDLSVQGSRIT